MKHAEDEQIAVVVNVSNEGAFLLYEGSNGNYREVYEKKLPVLSLQVVLGEIITIIANRGSGTNYWQHEHYVIRYTPAGYKEVWHGNAEYVKMFAEAPPGTVVTGSLRFSGPDELIYTQLKRVYEQPDSNKPSSVECTYQFFKYNQTDMKYETKG